MDNAGNKPVWRSFTGLTKDTFLLTCASFCSDISTEMLYPVLPIFLTQVLSAPASVVGLIEGFATAAQYLMQGFSGWLADRLHRAKAFAMIGYTVAALAKATIGFATAWPAVLISRVVDRLGTGMRSAPRDALIASSTTPQHRGKAFGLEGLGDNLGAFLGPLLAAGLLFVLRVDMRLIFFLTLVPGLLAALVIVPLSARGAGASAVTPPRLARSTEQFPLAYWKYLGVTALYGLGNSTNAFLILRAKQIGIPFLVTILIYAGFNLVAALASYPSGALSDILGRKRVLLLAILVFSITYTGFAVSANAVVIAVLFVLYGLHTGMYRAAGKALATDLVPQALRATGIGWYAATIGICELIASVVAGQLWTGIAPAAAFAYGAVLSVVALLAAQILIPPTHKRAPAGDAPTPQPAA